MQLSTFNEPTPCDAFARTSTRRSCLHQSRPAAAGRTSGAGMGPPLPAAARRALPAVVGRVGLPPRRSPSTPDRVLDLPCAAAEVLLYPPPFKQTSLAACVLSTECPTCILPCSQCESSPPPLHICSLWLSCPAPGPANSLCSKSPSAQSGSNSERSQHSLFSGVRH